MVSTYKKPFFDANILLSLLLLRGDHKQAYKLQTTLPAPEIYISSLSGHLVTHFKPKDIDLKILEVFLADYHMLDLTSDDFTWAFDNARDEDFEDALQVATAVRNGCDVFYTFDKKLYTAYSKLPTLDVVLVK